MHLHFAVTQFEHARPYAAEVDLLPRDSMAKRLSIPLLQLVRVDRRLKVCSRFVFRVRKADG